MEAFSIACTTCQARLRVRDESAIGQILTCPKCGSMVLVERPTDATARDRPLAHQPQPNTTASVGRPPTAAADFEDAADILRERSEPVAASADPSELADTVEDLSLREEQAPRQIEPPPLAESVSVEDQEGESHANDVDTGPLLPNEQWVSESTTRWRRRVLVGGAGFVGVMLALGATIVVNSFRAGSSNTPGRASVQVAQVEGSDTRDSTPSEVLTSEAAAQQEEVPAPQPTTEVEAITTEAAPDDSSDGNAGEVAALDSMPAEERSPLDAETPPVAPDETTVEEELPPALKAPDDAVDSDTATGAIAETLRDFSPVLSSVSSLPRPVPADATPAVEPPKPESKTSTDDDATPAVLRPPARMVAVDDRLNDPIAGIDFSGVPLVGFLRFVSDYSTIPITLDADMLVWAKLSPTTPVRVKLDDATVSEALSAGLSPLGLYYRIEGEQLFVTRRPKAEGALRAVTFKVTDLADSPERLQALSQLVVDLVAPESWSSRGGEGTVTVRDGSLEVTQREPILFEVLGFCERLRVARGLPTRSPYDSAVFRIASRHERAAERLAKPISFTYIRPTALVRILDRIAAETDVQFLVDWRSLGEAGWNPDAESTFVVAARPLDDALRVLLDPMELGYRIVDERTLWITTLEAIDLHLDVEFYRMESVLHVDRGELISAIHTEIGPDVFREQGGWGAVAIDEDSHCLIAALPQPKQIMLQEWLLRQTPREGRTTPTAIHLPDDAAR